MYGGPGRNPTCIDQARCAGNAQKIAMSQMTQQALVEPVAVNAQVIVGQNQDIALALSQATVVSLGQPSCIRNSDDFKRVARQQLVVHFRNAGKLFLVNATDHNRDHFLSIDNLRRSCKRYAICFGWAEQGKELRNFAAPLDFLMWQSSAG